MVIRIQEQITLLQSQDKHKWIIMKYLFLSQYINLVLYGQFNFKKSIFKFKSYPSSVKTLTRKKILYVYHFICAALLNNYTSVVSFVYQPHCVRVFTDWIGTLSFCISLSCAPISVAFIRCLRYRGYRLGSIIGTLILTGSCLSSSFAQNPEWLFVTHSLLYGVGSSLVYMASSLVIGEYFAKDHEYHVMATSILLCGYPIGR